MNCGFQLLALANGDRIKDKQRSRNSFVVDKEKKDAAENLLKELYSYHEAIIRQVPPMTILLVQQLLFLDQVLFFGYLSLRVFCLYLDETNG